MLKIMLNAFLYVASVFLLANTLNSQIIVNGFNNDFSSIKEDSIFSSFSIPAIDSCIYRSLDSLSEYEQPSSFAILCDAIFQGERVRKISFHPIIGYGNSFNADHYVWKGIVANLQIASKNWRVKYLFYDTKQMDSLSICLYDSINQGFLGNFHRPNHGIQKHIFVINIRIINGFQRILIDDSQTSSHPDLFYWLDTKAVIERKGNEK